MPLHLQKTEEDNNDKRPEVNTRGFKVNRLKELLQFN